MLRRHPVVLKETRNRADMNVSVAVEPECIPASVKHEKLGIVRQPFIHFPISEARFSIRNPFCHGAKVIDILPF